MHLMLAAASASPPHSRASAAVMVPIARNMGVGSPCRSRCATASVSTCRNTGSDIGDREVKLELVLSCVVLEEAIERGLSARELAAIVCPRKQAELDLSHA